MSQTKCVARYVKKSVRSKSSSIPRAGAGGATRAIRRSCAAVRITIGVIGIRLITARFPRFRERARRRFDELSRNLGEETRGHRSSQPVFAIAAAIDGARNHERLFRARHAHIKQPPLFLKFARAVRPTGCVAKAPPRARREDRVELESFRAMQRHQRNWNRLIVLHPNRPRALPASSTSSSVCPCSVASAIAFDSSRKFSARDEWSRLSCCSTQPR